MAKVATNTFEFDLPDTWKIETLQNPASIRGPGGELLMINSAVISGGKTDEDQQAVKDALQQNAEDSMQNAANDERLQTTKPLTNHTTNEGRLFAEMHCQTTDKTAWFSEFSIAGPATLVFVTVEGNAGTESAIDVVSNAVKNITWLQSPAASERKPFWKFW